MPCILQLSGKTNLSSVRFLSFLLMMSYSGVYMLRLMNIFSCFNRKISVSPFPLFVAFFKNFPPWYFKNIFQYKQIKLPHWSYFVIQPSSHKSSLTYQLIWKLILYFFQLNMIKILSLVILKYNFVIGSKNR